MSKMIDYLSPLKSHSFCVYSFPASWIRTLEPVPRASRGRISGQLVVGEDWKGERERKSERESEREMEMERQTCVVKILGRAM